MSQQYPYGVGISNVGSYQVSGIPFVSGAIALTTAPIQITFPDVTQRIFVAKHAGDNVRVGFSANGVNGTNYFLLSGNLPPQEFRVKVSSIFVRADSTTANISVSAELSNISETLLDKSGPTGLPNWSGSVGVG